MDDDSQGEEDYGFTYEDEDEELPDVEIENQFYMSEGLIDSDVDAAIDGFMQVIAMEQKKSEWGFKALNQMVLLYYKKGDWDKMTQQYRKLLTYVKDAVTRNLSENVINSILDHVSGCDNMEMLQHIYEATLTALEEAKNERLWYKTKLKVGNLYFMLGEYTKLQKVLRELHAASRDSNAPGSVDESKGTQLLEAYALEIQMYTAKKDQKMLKELYKKTLTVKCAIAHPRIMGVIRECGGKMYMAEQDWTSAATDFFEAFKNYDEAGNPRRIQCLKYLVLANMLMKSAINPFDSQEAKSYRNAPEIVAITELVSAYEKDDIKKFENILKRNRSSFYDDPFMQQHISELLKKIRSKWVLKHIQPYSRVSIDTLSSELGIDRDEVENLLALMILDDEIDGKIDQMKHILVLADKEAAYKEYDAVSKWEDRLKQIEACISAK